LPIAVNAVTNTVFSANAGSNGVSVIDGDRDAVTATVASGHRPSCGGRESSHQHDLRGQSGQRQPHRYQWRDSNAVSGNSARWEPLRFRWRQTPSPTPSTWRAKEAAASDGDQRRDEYGHRNLATGTTPSAVEVDQVNNKIYVTDSGSANVTVIDGATNTVETPAAAGTNPTALAVNLATDSVYVANNGSNNATVLTPNAINAIPLTNRGSGRQ
jgi:YVTN family beta-propeller protein